MAVANSRESCSVSKENQDLKEKVTKLQKALMHVVAGKKKVMQDLNDLKVEKK